jgi:hypothetical protein
LDGLPFSDYVTVFMDLGLSKFRATK